MYARPRACLNPASHPPPYIRPATRLLYTSAGPPVARELARLHAIASRAPGRSPHPRARPATRDRRMSPRPLAAPTSCTSPAACSASSYWSPYMAAERRSTEAHCHPLVLPSTSTPAGLPPWLLTRSGEGEHLTPPGPPPHRICLTKTW